jgi:hypothetical protein
MYCSHEIAHFGWTHLATNDDATLTYQLKAHGKKAVATTAAPVPVDL